MDNSETIRLLQDMSAGDHLAADRLIAIVYDDLRNLAASYLKNEVTGHTLQPTALVNEAFVKLVGQDRVDWRGRTHFFAVGAKMMRRILVDHARAGHRQKRGGGRQRIQLTPELAVSSRPDEDVLRVHDALEKLSQLDERQSRIVDLRYFGGLSVQEVADVMGMSKRSVEAEWTMIRAWLRRELSRENAP